MSKRDHIAVRVFYYPGKGPGCPCMSPRVSSPEEIHELLQQCSKLKDAMEATNPGRTSLEVVDLQLTPEERATEAGLLLVRGQYPSPLVFIDGEPRFAGRIEINRIVAEVGKMLNG